MHVNIGIAPTPNLERIMYFVYILKSIMIRCGGIGTTSPTAKLQVNGALAINGDPISGFKTSVLYNGDAANGIVKIFAKEIVTEKLCVEDICVTRDQFMQMVAASTGTVTITETMK